MNGPDHRAVAAARSEKVSRIIARLIVNDIAGRGLEPGSSLPPEHRMAEHYNVGRASVREALRLLEAQGLVNIRQGVGGGPVVGAPAGRELGTTLAMYLQVHQTPFRAAMEAAAELDGLVAGILAGKVAAGTSPGLDELDTIAHGELAQFETDDDVIDTATGFHDLMRRLAGNPVLDLTASAVAHIVTDRALGVRNYQWDHDERLMMTRDHRSIFEAISSGDVEAARERATVHMHSVGEMVARKYPSLLDEVVTWH